MKFLSENALSRIKLWALSIFCKTVELTQAQYDALTPEQKNDGTILYILTDVDPDNSGMRISWEDYQALTPEQQADGTYYVYDYPNSEGNGQTISKAQWDSMTPEQQSHGTYWVYDYDDDYIDASQVTYGSTDVGSAIDENASGISTLNSRLSAFTNVKKANFVQGTAAPQGARLVPTSLVPAWAHVIGISGSPAYDYFEHYHDSGGNVVVIQYEAAGDTRDTTGGINVAIYYVEP